mgnify:CR=1 FL=1
MWKCHVEYKSIWQYPRRLRNDPDGLFRSRTVDADRGAERATAALGRHDVREAMGSAPGAPGEVAEVSHRIVKNPEVAGAADALAGRVLILHG